MVECQIVALDVVGSIPISHPIFLPAGRPRGAGASPSGKARDFDSRIRRFESYRPSQFLFWSDPLAQSVEHLTFNQGVRGSNPRWVTKSIKIRTNIRFVNQVFGYIFPQWDGK